MMKIHLIENWEDSWKWISMQTAAIITVLNAFALTFPTNWTPYVHTTTVVLGALSMYGRLIQQTPATPKSGDTP